MRVESVSAAVIAFALLAGPAIGRTATWQPLVTDAKGGTVLLDTRSVLRTSDLVMGTARFHKGGAQHDDRLAADCRVRKLAVVSADGAIAPAYQTPPARSVGASLLAALCPSTTVAMSPQPDVGPRYPDSPPSAYANR